MNPSPGSGLLILLSAPSGAGKTSLVNAALERDPRLVVSVSHTTRTRRPGEADGVNYHFVDRAHFQSMLADGAFLEHAEVFGNLYGTSKASVETHKRQDRDVILEIDWQGAAQIRALDPDALSIFILPPSEAVLRERLTRRGQDSEASIERRLAEAKLEMSKAGDFQFIIVNDRFDRALADLLAVLQAARLSAARQTAHNPTVAALVGSAAHRDA